MVDYFDSDSAADRVDRKSMFGYTFLLGNTAVSWKSKNSDLIAMSITGAEQNAASEAIKEQIWIRCLYNKIL